MQAGLPIGVLGCESYMYRNIKSLAIATAPCTHSKCMVSGGKMTSASWVSQGDSLDELLGCVLLQVLLQVLDALKCNIGVEDQVVAAAQYTLHELPGLCSDVSVISRGGKCTQHAQCSSQPSSMTPTCLAICARILHDTMYNTDSIRVVSQCSIEEVHMRTGKVGLLTTWAWRGRR